MSAKKKDESPTTSTVSVRLDDEMKTVLEAIAYMERRTVSGLLSRLIEQHLRTYKRETIWEALREMKRRKDEERATNEDLPLWSLMEEVRQKEASDKASDTKAKKKK